MQPSGPKTTSDWHLTMVDRDSEFWAALEAAKATGEKHLESLREIAEEFCVPLEFVSRAALRRVIYLDPLPSRARFELGPNDCTLSIVFPVDATKAEFDAAWVQFREVRATLIRTEPTRRRATENPELIYAIFRARKTASFSEIFDAYAGGKLNGHGGSTTQFATPLELSRYYRRYQPKSIKGS